MRWRSISPRARTRSIAWPTCANAGMLMERLPTQTVRSEEQINLQQFSTPVDIAAIAVLLAAIGADDIVLEPSAGNGLLIAQAPTCAALQLNELDPRRRERLAGTFPDAVVTGHDGAGAGQPARQPAPPERRADEPAVLAQPRPRCRRSRRDPPSPGGDPPRRQGAAVSSRSCPTGSLRARA